jgi:hypothetical protein
MPNNYDYEPPIEPPGTVDEANQRLADFVASYARATFERMGHHTHWSGLAARLVEERDALKDEAFFTAETVAASPSTGRDE